ncbi:MAG: thermonuclease family protein [Bacteriovoracaceae bacterium]|nr:thermonuclease family protein [Bacteriovoracaceae bacterium]
MKKIPPRFKLMFTIVSLLSFALVSQVPQFQKRSDSRSPSADESIDGRSPENLISVKVLKVSDGDTLTVELLRPEVKQNNSKFYSNKERVRLIGVDAPEKSQAVWGLKAKEYLKGKVNGKVVQLEADVRARDQYGRMLAYVYLDKELVNESLIRDGLAMVYTMPPNVSKVERLTKAQDVAKKNKLGIWGNESPLAEIPSEYRRKHRNKSQRE